MSDPETERRDIEAALRNGGVTVVGVLAGFLLIFLTAPAANPVPGQLHDRTGMAPLAAGIVLQLVALAALLHPNALERR